MIIGQYVGKTAEICFTYRFQLIDVTIKKLPIKKWIDNFSLDLFPPDLLGCYNEAVYNNNPFALGFQSTLQSAILMLLETVNLKLSQSWTKSADRFRVGGNGNLEKEGKE